MTSGPQTASGAMPGQPTSLTVAGILLGVGLGGFVDGIVLHQLLQWHHMLTSEGSYPATTVVGLEKNTLWDGLFHVSTWIATVVALWMLWQRRHRTAWTGRYMLGLMLAGWGIFNIVEGIVDHHILTIHHVRDDAGAPVGWDLAFLGLGALLLLSGVVMARSGERATTRRIRTGL
jgi:uncharacterized membrane protein